MGVEPYRDSIHIEAEPDLVFEYFTRPDALVRWMGDRAVLNPRPGGEFTLWFDERCVQGRYVEVDRPRRLVITWGRRGSREMPPFSSTLEVTFTPEAGGTRVSIVHRACPTTRRHVTRSGGSTISAACRCSVRAASPSRTSPRPR